MLRLVVFQIHAIIKTACFNWLPWRSTRSSHWEVFLEINLNQKTLKFYTSWVHWKNQCRSTVRKHALLRNKHEYQHSADIVVTHFMALAFFYTSWMKYIRKPEVAWWFQGASKETSTMKWVKGHLILSYLLCYLFK